MRHWNMQKFHSKEYQPLASPMHHGSNKISLHLSEPQRWWMCIIFRMTYLDVTIIFSQKFRRVDTSNNIDKVICPEVEGGFAWNWWNPSVQTYMVQEYSLSGPLEFKLSGYYHHCLKNWTRSHNMPKPSIHNPIWNKYEFLGLTGSITENSFPGTFWYYQTINFNHLSKGLQWIWMG